MSELLVNVYRGGVVESKHRGDLVVLDSRGRVIYSLGSPDTITFWRSAAKPFQALPLVEEGGMEQFGLTGKELALITASHGGEEEHVNVIKGMLSKMGLTPENLDCGAAPPMNTAAAKNLLKNNQPFQALHNACSGKHTGMLALCLLKGWPVQGYHQVSHPLQQATIKVISEMTDVLVTDLRIGIDGCGVPVFAMPIYHMALAYTRLSLSQDWHGAARREALQRICSAMITYPFYVAGTKRLDTALMETTGGRLVAKLGAESVYCVGLVNEGRALCLKIEDGSYRALDPVVVKVLYKLGWLKEVEYQRLQPWCRPPLKNHRGEVIGHLEATIDL